jgi:hypothetical protein
MTSPGGSGMDFGDDYIATRLSIDVPEEGIQGMRELADGVERFRTAMEATARTESDMVRYLDQMTEASKRATEAQQNLTQSVTAFQQLTGRVSSGPAVGSSGVPLGTMQQPWEANAAGTGVARPPSPSDVFYQLQAGSNTHPHEFLNAQQARGGVSSGDSVNLSPASIGSLAAMIAARDKAMNVQSHKTGDPQPSHHPSHQSQQADPYASFQNRAQGATGVAGSIMNEIAGGNGMGFGGMAVQGMNALRSHLNRKAAAKPGNSASPDGSGGEDSEDDGVGGLSGLAKGLGIGGGVLTAVLGAAKLVQSGGAAIQGMRDIGSQRGGGAGEGFQASMKARLLGMDPSISTGQGREIVQSEMSGGYADASGNTGVPGLDNFFKNNIKDYGMSVSQTSDLLSSTAKLTKLSVEDLAAGLGQLKEASVSGYQSLPDMIQATTANFKQLVAQGVNPQVAYNTSVSNARMFNHDPILAGTQSTPIPASAFQMMVANGSVKVPSNLSPLAYQRYIQDQGSDVTEAGKLQTLKQFADMAKQGTGDANNGDVAAHDSAVALFQQMATQFAPELQDTQVADKMYMKLEWSGQSPQQIVQQQKKQNEKDTAGDRKTTSRQVGQVPDAFGLPGNSISGGSRGHTEYSSNTIDRISAIYGGGDAIEVMDKDGKKVGNLDRSNKDQIDKLDSGEYTWRHTGDKGKGIRLAETPTGFGSGYSTDSPNDVSKQGPHGAIRSAGKGNPPTAANSGVQIELGPQAQKLFQIIDPADMPSANQASVNKGDSGFSLNNPPTSAPTPYK